MRDGSGLIEAQPKQDEQRTIPFAERVAAALKTHRLRQNEERLAGGALYGDRDLVFATSKGTPFEASNGVNRSFKPLLKRAGLPDILATVVALVWANSPWGDSYAALWDSKSTVGLGDFSLSKGLTHWINDGLMAVFFLVVGLEIKCEVLVGELSSIRGAALPVVAAMGGAVVPAAIYVAINAGTEGAAGW